MTELIADFFGRFAVGASREPDLLDGRILMNQDQIVLAADDTRKISIPLRSIYDVSVGHVPPKFQGFFDDTITISFEKQDTRQSIVIEGDDDSIERFVDVLLKSLLNGVEIMIKHPAKVGGRVVDTDPAIMYLQVDNQQVTFQNKNTSVNIVLSNVTDYTTVERQFKGETRTFLEIHHYVNGESLTTELLPPSARIAKILGRHLRLEYKDLRATIADISLTKQETQALVGLYSVGEGIDISSILSGEPTENQAIIRSLTEKGLINDGPAGTRLTPEGRVMVQDRIEEVNL